MAPVERGDLTSDVARRRWFVLAIAVVIGILPLFPPSLGDEQSPAAFATSRALRHIEWIAAAPRPMGSLENVRVRERIVDELSAIGVDSERQLVTAPDWFDPAGAPVDVVNVVARIPGNSPTGAVAVVGHFDTVPTTPGANDNASAVAVMLETARIIQAGDQPRNDVVFVFTDGEEPAPKFGATAFVDDHRWFDDIEFVINLEAIGSSGPSLLVEASGPSGWVTDQYLGAAPHPATYSFLTELTAMIGGSNTDFARFRDAGVPGVEMVYLRGSPIYHTMDDTPGRVGAHSLHQQGANTVALLRHVAEIDLTEPRSDTSRVLITVGRGRVVQYSGWLAIGALALAALAIGIAHRTVGELRGSAASALIALGRGLALAVGASVIWILVAQSQSSMGIATSYLYLSALVVLVGVGTIALHRARPGRITPAGIATLWLALALVGLAVGPGTSALFVWPALFSGLALTLRRRTRRLVAVELAELVAVVTAVVLTIPAIDILFQFAQPRPGNPDSQITPTIVVPLLLVAFVVELMAAMGGASLDADAVQPDGRVPDLDHHLAEFREQQDLHVGAQR